MKLIISLILLVALGGVLSEDKMLIALGKRESDDQLLARFTQKSEIFATPQLIRVDIDYSLDATNYFTYILFTSPNDAKFNSTVQYPVAKNGVTATFLARDQLSYQVDVAIYGWLYSPGPVYP